MDSSDLKPNPSGRASKVGKPTTTERAHPAKRPISLGEDLTRQISRYSLRKVYGSDYNSPSSRANFKRLGAYDEAMLAGLDPPIPLGADIPQAATAAPAEREGTASGHGFTSFGQGLSRSSNMPRALSAPATPSPPESIVESPPVGQETTDTLNSLYPRDLAIQPTTNTADLNAVTREVVDELLRREGNYNIVLETQLSVNHSQQVHDYSLSLSEDEGLRARLAEAVQGLTDLEERRFAMNREVWALRKENRLAWDVGFFQHRHPPGQARDDDEFFAQHAASLPTLAALSPDPAWLRLSVKGLARNLWAELLRRKEALQVHFRSLIWDDATSRHVDLSMGKGPKSSGFCKRMAEAVMEAGFDGEGQARGEEEDDMVERLLVMEGVLALFVEGNWTAKGKGAFKKEF